MALQAGSPAIGAGVTAVFPGTDTPITTDQSGADLNSPPDLGALQYVPPITPTVTISTGSLNLGSTTAGTAGSTESYFVSGSNLTADILIDAPTGVELSDDGGMTWHTSLDLAESGGTVDTTTIDARIAASASVGDISGNITNSSTGATAQDVSVSGTVNAVPTITVSTESLNLGSTTAGTAGSTESYTVSGTGLTADILIDAPTGVELSDDGGTTWHTSLDLTESGGTVDTTTIDARIAASASVGGISGAITNTSTGATEQDVSVSGTVNAVPTIIISTGTLALGTTTTGTAGSTESYTVSGLGAHRRPPHRRARAAWSSPTTAASTWSTSLDLTETGGTVDTTTIDARIAASASVGGISGEISQHQHRRHRAGRERQRDGQRRTHHHDQQRLADPGLDHRGHGGHDRVLHRRRLGTHRRHPDRRHPPASSSRTTAGRPGPPASTWPRPTARSTRPRSTPASPRRPPSAASAA